MKIQRPKLKVILIFLITSVCLILLASFYFIRKNEDRKLELKTKQTTPISPTEEEFEGRRRTISLDMNGDGKKEMVIIHPEGGTKNGYIGVYNEKEEEIARTSEEAGTPPVPLNMEAYILDTSDPREFLAMEYIAGPHQFKTMFMVLEGDTIYSISKAKNPKGVEDYYFYITQDSLIVADIDKDGFSEVCEIASVYPPSKELSDDVEKTIDETFGEVAEDAKKIAGMEQGQRVPVIWSIYSFNGEYFEAQADEAYNQLFDLLIEGGSHRPMKKSEMSQSEVEYTERTRNFWTHR